MNNRKLILIIVIAVIGVSIASTTAYFLLTPQYTEYSDEYIQIELPAETDLNVHSDSNPRIYKSTNDTVNITITSFNSSNNNSKIVYGFVKAHLESNLSSYKLNQTEYNGTIYNNSGEYTILIFNDTDKTMVSLHSKDLNTVIHMGQTFKLLKKPAMNITNNTTQINEYNTQTSNKSNNSTYFDPYEYWDYYYDNYGNYYDDYYYDDYYYDDYYYDDYYYDDYDDYYYDDYYYDDYYY